MPRKGLDLSQMPPDNFWMRKVSVLVCKLGDVVALVCVSRCERACRARLIAAEIARGCVAGVFELFVEGEVEDRGGEGVLASDLGVGEAVACDVEEALWRYRLGQLELNRAQGEYSVHGHTILVDEADDLFR